MSKVGAVWIVGCSLIVVLANVALRFCMDRSSVKLFSSGLAGLANELLALVREPMFYLALASYGCAMLIWFRLIATEPLSVAYPALAAVTFVGVTLAGMLILHEPIVPLRIAGVFVIIVGFVLISGA